MSSSISDLAAMVRRSVFRGFGMLPLPVRRFLVRLLSPTWTAGAVAVIERDDGRWLVVSPVYRSGWAFPGGLLDRGERPEVAIRREMREELGLEIEITESPWIVHDAQLRRIDTVFMARPAAGVDVNAIVICTPELDDLGWFERADLPELEDEAHDIIELVDRVGAGESRVLFR